MLRRLTILLAALSASLVPVAGANAGDASATHAYLKASYSTFKTSIAHIRLVGTNVDKLNQQLAGECPDAGKGSPQNEDAQQLSYEAFGALEAIAFHTDAKLIGSYTRAVSPLRWSNSRITRDSRSYLQSLRQLVALKLPDLCADTHSWSATSYKTVPASTLSFDHQVEAIDGHTVPLKLLAPYESSSDRALAKRVKHLEVELEQLETLHGQDWWNLILQTVGLNQ
jgi:hypothetical protein